MVIIIYKCNHHIGSVLNLHLMTIFKRGIELAKGLCDGSFSEVLTVKISF